MIAIEPLVADFLAQRCIAVAGVSNRKESPANGIYRKLKKAGYHVYAVNPHGGAIDGDICYGSIEALPERPDGVVVVTRPEGTEAVARACVAAGVPRVWMHCALGTTPRFMAGAAAAITSVSAEAVRLLREAGVTVIPGGCPMMFVPPVDVAHRCVRGLLSMTGNFSA